jgi:hypothetical protein
LRWEIGASMNRVYAASFTSSSYYVRGSFSAACVEGGGDVFIYISRSGGMES